MNDWKGTIKYILIVAAIVLVGFLLQTCVFSKMELAGVTPNIILIVIASFGLMRGRKQGMLIGFFCGLLLDFFSGSIIGMYAIIYLYIGLLSGLFKRLFFGDDIKLPLLLIAASDIAYGILIYLLLFLTRGQVDFIYYFMNLIMPEAVYTLLVAIPLYYILLSVNRQIDKDTKRRAGRLV